MASKTTHLTFDDVLLVPKMSLPSRGSAQTWGTIFYGLNEVISFEHPIIPANMDTICGEKMAKEIAKSGGIAIIHRFMDYESRITAYNEAVACLPNSKIIDNKKHRRGHVVVSVGCSDEEVRIGKKLIDNGVTALCIDVANGFSCAVANAIREFKQHRNPTSELWIIAGNIATIEGFEFLVEAGADCIKVGIGPGSHCTTRLVTGCGIPQLSAIMHIADYRNRVYPDIKIIADGGIKNSGDIVKALAAGADMIMTGSLFAGCEETPGELIVDESGNKMKVYRGMASKDAQMDWRKIDSDKIVPEGESSLVPYNGTFKSQLDLLVGGLKSGMSYLTAYTLDDLRTAQFIKVSTNTVIENKPHGKRI